MADTPDTSFNAFLTLALTRWRTAETAETPMRQAGEKDLQFLNLEQWEQTDIDARDENRPALTIDQIGEPYRQLVGQFRRAHPGIQVSPVDNGADLETAERYQGAIRQIETSGGAKAAREEAFKGAVGPGWGYYRLYTEYDYDAIPEYGDLAAIFDQCIKYQPIENQFSVFRDPSTPLHEPWKCRWAFVIEHIPHEEFAARWPNKLATNQDCFAATGLSMPEWYPEGSVAVADYLYLDEEKGEEYAVVTDGRVVPASQATPAEVVQRRTPTRKVVKLAKMTGAEILEGNDVGPDETPTEGRVQPWPFIPIVPMWGESLTVKGKRTLRGIVRAARDPQRMYNFEVSELVYEHALAPKSKVMAPYGAIQAHEAQWKTAPSQAHTALYYDAWDGAGRQLPEPRVAHFTDSAKIQAGAMLIAQFKTDLRSTTGWYDATDPNRKNADQSGRAILARKESQAEGSINFLENASQAIRFEAMLLIGAIPKIYNRTGRAMQIAGLEDPTDSESLVIGQPIHGKDGETSYFAWGAGRYDIRIDIGASYGTRRQEAATSQIELMKVLPEQMAAAMAPIAVRNMDGPGNREIADRLDRVLPPQIRGDDTHQPDPQQLAQENQQLKAVLQQDAEVIKGLQDAIKQDMVKAEAGLAQQQAGDAATFQQQAAGDATKLQIERIKAEVEMAKIRAEMLKLTAELDAEAAKVAVQEETKRLLKMADLEVHQQDLAVQRDAEARGMVHERGMAEMGHRQALEVQAAQPSDDGSAV